MSPPPLVSIIVITLNTPRMTAACLRSVVRNSSVPYELIVVNNSRASGIRRCLRRFPSTRVIQNPENFGFSRAANQGIVSARGQYLCLLNTDTLVPPRWLERLVEAIQKPGVAAVGPASEELYGPLEGKPWPFPFSPDNEEKTAQVDRIFQQRNRNRMESVPFLHGFCLLLSRIAVASTGLLDEGYFFGLEDIDYCLQLRIHGYRLLRVHSLFVHHQQGASSTPERRRRLVDQSENYFVQKWTTPLSRPGIDFSILFRQLNQKIPLRRKAPEPTSSQFPVPLRRTAPRRLIRKGFRVQTMVQTMSQTSLIRFPDLDMFTASPKTDRLWCSLRGGWDPVSALRKASPAVQRQIEQLFRFRLIGEIHPRQPARCLVTVMMVAHQAERWIDQAIESVLAQQFQDFELIILDDGSLDGTSRVIRQYAWHPQIRLISHAIQRGIPVSRNRILQEARGKYIAVCDADDIMLPTCLRRFVPLLEQRPRIAWVYANRMGILSGGTPVKIYRARQPDGKTEFRVNVMAHAGALIRREAIEAAGGYSKAVLSTEDYDLALQIAQRWKILALPGEMHYLWRQHSESLSRVNPWARIETTKILKRAKQQRSLRS